MERERERKGECQRKAGREGERERGGREAGRGRRGEEEG